MITPTNAYLAFSSQAVQDTRHVVYLPDRGVYISNGTIPGISAFKAIRERPSLIETQVDPLSATSSPGSVSIKIVDVDSFFMALRQAGPILGERATFKTGYAGLHWDDFLQVVPGTITDADLDKSGLLWSIQISDALSDFSADVFSESAIAAEPFTGNGKSFDGGTLTLWDTDGDSKYDRVILSGDPIEIALKVMRSGASDAGDWNTWPAWAGAGLRSEQIDIDWCLGERDVLLSPPMSFVIDGEESARSFVEQDICMALGGYLLVGGTGKIRLRFPSSPNPAATLITISDADIVAPSGLPSFKEAGAVYLSHVTYELDYDGNDFLTTIKRASPQFLDGLVRERRSHPISARGQQTALGGADMATIAIDQLFARYGSRPPLIQFSTKFGRLHLAEAGDVLAVTSKRYPDWDGRGPTATRYLEALSVKAGPRTVEFTAIDLTTPITAAARAIIAPNSASSSWTTATEADKMYAYISGPGGLFSDGASAYVWS